MDSFATTDSFQTFAALTKEWHFGYATITRTIPDERSALGTQLAIKLGIVHETAL